LLFAGPAVAASAAQNAGGSFGAPIRSRLVGDGSLPEEVPPPALASRPSDGIDIMRRSNSWRPGGESTTPPERWNGGPPTPVRAQPHSDACQPVINCAAAEHKRQQNSGTHHSVM
jgi:hypothetical protein